MPDGSSPRRPINVTLPEALIIQAKEMKINISQACEAGLAAQVKAVRAAKWLKDNRAAMDYWNNLAETEGLLLADLRVLILMRFDVYRLPGRPSIYAVDVQTDLLSHLATTVIIPAVLKPPERRIEALHPVVRIEDQDYMLATHQLFSIVKRDLGKPIASLAARRDDITRALDLLLTGF